ncbi:Panacea domain-containing protein [Spiroplasma endosymbiont of Nebria brevicollis]|uniref:Panacea domain-containing protein n=1 Tax=Spiroplasma endosymbiont of Nebria brevicollis TaxID=3066284 RepID=UPI00313C7A4B
MKNKEINVNDFFAFLLKTNEEMQNRVNIDEKDMEGLSNLKIQKLLYFIEANFLKKYNTQLFSNDYYVWEYGPVIPELYKQLKKFGKNPIFYEEFKKKWKL